MALKKLSNAVYESDMTYILAGNVKEEESNPTNHDFEIHRATDGKVLNTLHFQQGALGPDGVEGILNEDLLAILIDRIESFTRSKTIKSPENNKALDHLYEAMFWLNKRQRSRKKKD